MGDTIAQTRSERVSKLSNYSLLARVNDQDDEQMFNVNDLQGEEVFIQEDVADKEPKKKDQVRLDEEVPLKLQVEFKETTKRLARESAQKEKEANIALIKEWNDIQAKIDADINWLKDYKQKNNKN
nr:hypothetical protein [Tanacetum cinerariifolium]